MKTILKKNFLIKKGKKKIENKTFLPSKSENNFKKKDREQNFLAKKSENNFEKRKNSC